MTATPTGGGKSKGSKGSKSSTKTKTNEAVKGSLGDLEKQLSDLQTKYKNGLITLLPEDYRRQVEDLERQIKEKKIELGLEVDTSVLLKQLSSIVGKEVEIDTKIKADDPKNLIS